MVYEQRYQCPCVQKNRSHSLPLVKGIRSRHRWRFYLQPLENDAEICDTQEMMETYISIYCKELHCPDWKGGLIALSVQFSSVHFSRSVVSASVQPHESQHTRPPCPSPTPRVYPNSCPSSRWCHPANSSSVIPFSSCPQSLPASGSFPMSQLCIRWPKY